MRGLAIGAAVFLVLGAACGDDDGGDDGGDGAADETTTTAAEPADDVDTTAETGAVATFASDDFVDQGEIPVELTCDGANRSPELHWEGLPTGTETVAVIVDDPDAPGGSFIHWVIWDVPAAEGSPGSIEGGSVPAGAIEGANGAGGIGWTGPCPPPGDGPHRYLFSLYAVPGTLDEAPGAPADEVRDGIADALGTEIATLTGVYERSG